MSDLASALYHGLGAPADIVAASKWYNEAASRGDVRAQVSLAVLYYERANDEESQSIAATWLRFAAEQWYFQAQFLLAKAYEEGHGVPKDPIEAYKWSRLAADRGYNNAGILCHIITNTESFSPDQIEEGKRRASEFARTNRFQPPEVQWDDVLFAPSELAVLNGGISDDKSIIGLRAAEAVARGDYKSAVENGSKLIEINEAVGYFARGEAYAAGHEYDKAIKDLNFFISVSPKAPAFVIGPAFLAKGEVYTDAGDWEQAVSNFSEAIRLEPGYGRYYFERACAFSKGRNFTSAIFDCSNAISIFRALGVSNGYAISAYHLRGKMYSMIGSDKCFDDFQSAINLDPGDHRVYLARGNAYAKKSMYALALADYDEVIKLSPSNALGYSGRGLMFASEGDYVKGFDDCKEAIKVGPTCGTAFARLAWLLAVCPDAKFRDGQKAVEYAKKACDLSGWKEPEAVNALAAAEAEVGHFDEAVKWLNKCMEFDDWPEKNSDKVRQRLDFYRQGKPFHEGTEK